MRVVTFGETMALLRASDIGSLAHVSRLQLSIGGAESNVSVALARMGVPVTWVGRVGEDSFGRRVVRELRAEGIEVMAVVDPHAPTGVMVKESVTTTATRVSYYRKGSAGSRLTASDLQPADISSASIVHVTGITVGLSDTAADALNTAVDLATSAGVPVSFDVNHRVGIWRDRDPAATYRRIAARSTIVFAGEAEAELLAGFPGTPVELASAIANLGPSQVVIKLGANGCLALVAGQVHVQAAVQISPVDTVGAGDAFVGTYLAELLRDAPAEQRLATAVAAAAFACLNPGDWEGYARREDLTLLTNQEPVTR